MGDRISEHFLREEFACKCGCGQDTVDIKLLKLSEIVRVYVAVAVSVNSGNRCASYNRLVSGAEGSQHLKSKAGDLDVVNPLEVFEYLCSRFTNHFGFGVYDTFVHVDSRAWKARWDLRSNK